MKPTLDEQDMSVYASDAQTIQEPYGSDYSQGVRVGKTIPAKWWNWLFKAVTTRLHQGYNDIASMFTELKNLILSAGLTLSSEDNTQVIQSIVIKTDEQLPRYIAQEKECFARRWEQYSCYNEDGNKIYIPNRIKIGDYLFSISSSTGDEYYSKDGIHWKTIASRNNNTGALNIACYCNNYYISIIDEAISRGSTNLWYHTFRVRAGTSPDTMQAIDTGVYYEETAGGLTGLSHVVVGNKVIILTSARTVYILDTTNLTCTEYTGLTFQGIAPYISHSAGNDCIQTTSVELPSVMVNGAYIFGGCVRYDGTTISSLIPGVTEPLINTHVPRRLRNGNIVFMRTASYSYLSYYESYIMDTNGNVTVAPYNYMPIYTQAYLDDCVLKSDLSDNSISFSYDGTNFSKLPFTFDVANIVPFIFGAQSRTWSSIIQKDNKYFIVPRGASPSFTVLSLYEIDNTLSDDIEDYFDTQFNMVNSNINAVGFNQIMSSQTYDYKNRVGGPTNVSVSGGEIELYYGKFIPIVEKYSMVFRSRPSGGSYNMATSFGVNTVVDYTLYLR